MAFIEPKSVSLAKIKVVGVGGGGQNAVDSMIVGDSILGVEFVSMNTDLQALNSSNAQVRVQLGPERTHGLGSGSDPEVGKEAAEESVEDIKSYLQGTDMVFIAAGMGGGTGSGAAPIIAQLARETGALTVGVVTKPFLFEGKRRLNQAEQAIRELRGKVDALIVIPNEKLLEIVDKDVPLTSAFKIADEVIGKAVEGISDLITSTGLVNVDFADVKSIMKNAGSALMGVGQADGENRAEKAAGQAINSPLLDVDIKGSTGVLINIVGDSSLTMHEVNTAARLVSDAAHEGANIIFGANIDPAVDGIRVTVIATGFDVEYAADGIVFPGIEGEAILEQIDSRLDQSSGEAQGEDKKGSKDTGDNDDFDIEKLREEVRRMEENETASDVETNEGVEVKDKEKKKDKKKKEKSEDDTADSSFWSFISSRKSS